jgi:8-oxo-dGTP pyrophosphatase MutT (NUDIX family)
MTTSPSTAPVTPRLAATLILLRDDPLRVLMVKRHPQAFFPSALVFPGGAVDVSDHGDDWLEHLSGHEVLEPRQRALRIAACRETWEEAGLLVSTAPQRPLDPSAPGFRQVLAGAGARIDLSALVPFGHWITPPQVPKRFDTHFFLSRAPADGEAICDGAEIVATEWVEPAELIQRAAAGDQSVMFSTLMNIHRIAASATVAEALSAARDTRVVTVMPSRSDGPSGTLISIPPGSGYPVTEACFDRIPRIS